ncbi:hypothetical protein SAMN05444678_1304 [Sphingomonas sp. YR710]|uniref:hypothetical protein n=1 Tax=Sphingomonas sp. YR710 TaxID=1882773 RepID=UPI000887515B|nr:hypothetical protein [Sphingomonas sp. YR710]SDD88189.1 hypothetical protein SAMN05444678_1304 [Sphingomonas sp. YR710]
MSCSTLSEAARAFRERMRDPEAFLESCDGGDAGTPNARSIWLLGLEPGWSRADAANKMNGGHASELLRNYAVDLQLKWPFNRNAFKLLSVLSGGNAEDYEQFARQFRPFERGCKGYFKGNLYPVACNRISAWTNQDAMQTGFDQKSMYHEWMREVRLPIVRSWVEKCNPSLIICLGLTHLDDFTAATSMEMPRLHEFQVSGHKKRIYMGEGSVPTVVLPHLSGGSNGLNSNEAISYVARYIRSALLQ